jgi:peptide deformylase
MAILNLVNKNDPILKTELEHFDFSNPPTDPIELAHDLAQTMIDRKGIGLAANQVGLPYRVFVISGEQILACFNPRIVDYSSEQVYMIEGCLSHPGLAIKVKRPSTIKVRYTQPNGETKTEKFQGLTARVFQHELDHLNGIVHINRASLIHKEQAFKQQRAFQKIVKRTTNVPAHV